MPTRIPESAPNGEETERWAATRMQRARIPTWIGIGVVGVVAVVLPILLDMASIVIFALPLIASLAFCIKVMGQPTLFRWGTHAVYFCGLVTVGYAVFAEGLSPLITAYFPAMILLAAAYILGTRAAIFWSVPSLLLVAAEMFYPPEFEREFHPALTFGVRAVSLLSILAFAISFRRDHEEQSAKLERHATTDSLTGLANRREFDRRLDDSLGRSRRFPRSGAVVYLDLDGLKEVNDRMGHEAGDDLIRATANRIASMTRRIDTPARLGGDEFAVILVELNDAKGAQVFAQRLLALVREPVAVGDEVVSPSASIGIASFDTEPKDAADLVREADTAMYAAKRAGGDSIFLQTPDGPRRIV